MCPGCLCICIRTRGLDDLKFAFEDSNYLKKDDLVMSACISTIRMHQYAEKMNVLQQSAPPCSSLRCVSVVVQLQATRVKDESRKTVSVGLAYVVRYVRVSLDDAELLSWRRTA